MAPKRQASTAQKATKPREPNGKSADASQGRKRKAPVESEKAVEPVRSHKKQKGKWVVCLVGVSSSRLANIGSFAL